MAKIHHYLSAVVLTLLFGITPWLFNPYGNWIFELPKARAIYIGIIALILLSTWTLQTIKLSQLLVIVGIYLTVMLITGVAMSTTPQVAFWGTYTRQLGFLGYLHLFLFPFFLAEIIASVGTRFIYKVIALGSLGTSLLALSQYTPISPFAAVESFGFRLYGSFGEPNLLGYYLVLTLFPIWQIIKETSQKAIARYFYLAILLLACWTIIDSGSRGAMLALLASVIMICLQHSKLLLHKYRLHTAISGVIVIIFLGGVFMQQIQDRHSFLNLRVMNNVTIAIRAQIWKQTLSAANQKWLTGYGFENLPVAFTPKPQALTKLLYNPDEVIDRAHNDALDHYYSGGIWGLISYLLLMGSALFYAFRLWQKQNIIIPLGIIIQFLIISSLGPVSSSHLLFFSLALTLLHLANTTSPLRLSFTAKLLITLGDLFFLISHSATILQDFR